MQEYDLHDTPRPTKFATTPESPAHLMSAPHVKAAMAWLDESPDYRRAAQRVDTLLGIQSTLAELRPDLRLKAVSLNDGVLTLATPNASAAARYRQLEPSIRESLQRFWPEVNRIRFSPQRIETPVYRRSNRNREIPVDALGELDRLGNRLESSPLQRALQRLVARRRLSR